MLDGDAVMAYLDVPPGPIVGRALAFLLELKRTEGVLERSELERRLDQWSATQ